MSKNIRAGDSISFCKQVHKEYVLSQWKRNIFISSKLIFSLFGEDNQEFPLLSTEATGVCGNKNHFLFFYSTRVFF